MLWEVDVQPAKGQPDRAGQRVAADAAELGLAGNLRAYTFTNASGQTVRGDQVDYNGAKAGYADQPDEVISYVDAHDNETIWDELTYKLPVDTSMADRIRLPWLAISSIILRLVRLNQMLFLKKSLWP